jgi:hypothetical protein
MADNSVPPPPPRLASTHSVHNYAAVSPVVLEAPSQPKMVATRKKGNYAVYGRIPNPNKAHLRAPNIKTTTFSLPPRLPPPYLGSHIVPQKGTKLVLRNIETGEKFAQPLTVSKETTVIIPGTLKRKNNNNKKEGGRRRRSRSRRRRL